MTSLKTVNLMCGTVALKRLSVEEVKNMRTRFFISSTITKERVGIVINIVVHYTVYAELGSN